jgi:putative transposase
MRFRTFDRVLDRAGAGPLWLKDPRIAECVISTLQNGQAKQMFRLRAYVVMANHVHVLLEPIDPIGRITQALKGKTAREGNRLLGLTGARFWQEESFDHWIRTPQEWTRIRTYIERNPVSAGLVAKPEDWLWSSASRPIR